MREEKKTTAHRSIARITIYKYILCSAFNLIVGIAVVAVFVVIVEDILNCRLERVTSLCRGRCRRWFYYYAQHIRFILLLLLFASWLDSCAMLLFCCLVLCTAIYFSSYFFFSFESHACAHIIHPTVYGCIDGWLTFVICVVNVRRWTHTIYSFLVDVVSFWCQRAHPLVYFIVFSI